MYCPKCKNKMSKRTKFCSNCGFEIKESKEKIVEEPTKSGNKYLPMILIALIIIVLVFFLARIGINTNNPNILGAVVSASTSILPTPTQITVSGIASSSGQGTQPISITFRNNAGNNYVATVTSGQYSIQLPNPGTYAILASWSGSYTWQTDTITVQNPLILNEGPGGSTNTNLIP